MAEEIAREFVAAYAGEFNYYQAAARLCCQRCEALLAARGVKAIVTYRAKWPTKLLEKLLQRDGERHYESSQQIRDDIADLAGVRIALYFPGDRDRAAIIVQNGFNVVKVKNFPQATKKRAEKRFEGYYADHYRVQMLDSSLDETQKTYAAANIEIQVGSVLMHAWAEVEHDLVYKPESGNLSEDEHAILDELNGLVVAGEIALERLQRAVERRLTAKDVRFDNHYELAAFLYNWVRGYSLSSEPPMGRVDILWELLRQADLKSATKLTELLGSLTPLAKDKPVSDEIADVVLAKHPDLYNAYVSLQARLALPSIYDQSSSTLSGRTAAIGNFLSSWILLERTFSILGEHVGTGTSMTSRSMPYLARQMKLSPEALSSISRVRMIRNQLVHGIEIPSRAYLDEATSELRTVLAAIASHPDEAVRAAYEEARRPLHG